MRSLLTAAAVAVLLAGCSGAPEASPPGPIVRSEVKTHHKPKDHSDRKHPDRRETAKPHRDRHPDSPKPTPTRKPPSPPKPTTYLVSDVIDGDTVTVAKGGGTTIRIIGIDTPETVHPSEPVECGGPQASAAAVRMLSGKRVRLVYDPSQGRFDVYDRTLAYLTVPGIGDFGLAMVRRGLAAEYTYDTAYANQSLYWRAESIAQNKNLGVWGRCNGVDTPLVAPRPLASNPGGSNCASGYSPCVPPYPPDLDCADIDGPVSVTGGDPHGFDADGDGTGCDS